MSSAPDTSARSPHRHDQPITAPLRRRAKVTGTHTALLISLGLAPVYLTACGSSNPTTTTGAGGGMGTAQAASGAGGAGGAGVSTSTSTSSASGGGSGPTACVPKCDGKQCGSDGCAGICGACAPTQLCEASACTAVGASNTADIVVDTAAVTHSIHPEIYGVAFATKAQLSDLNSPLNRNGGNGATRYNWELDVHSTAADWYFENIADKGEGTFGAAGYVSTADVLVRDTLAAGATTLTTIPTIGWTPKARVTQGGHDCGFPKTEYPNQSSFDQYDANCGNGKDASDKAIAGAPTDAANTSKMVGPEDGKARIAHTLAQFGATYGDRTHFYALDNEMMLWSSTHRDVHPENVSYAEVWQKTLDYAPAIREADPSAFILGYGTWSAWDTLVSGVSGEDKTYGMPLMEWYLKQLADYESAHGKRLIDCVDLHYYPNQVAGNLNSPRSLWDPTYVDESWLNDVIGAPVRLFPRVREWIKARYPGTDICVSEYNFFPDDPVALLLQAEVLGIFGREDLRLASYWTTPFNSDGSPKAPYWAFRMYRNYDGKGGTFGDQALASATALDGLSVFAAKRKADDAVTVMIVNKNAADRTVSLSLQASSAQKLGVYSIKAGDAAITTGTDVTVAGGIYSVQAPGHSVVLVTTK